MITVRNLVYAAVAAGSLLMAGVQAMAGDEELVEASAIGLGQGPCEASVLAPSSSALVAMSAA